MTLSATVHLKAIGIAILLCLLLSQGSWAHHSGGYSHDASIEYRNPHWMSLVSGQYRLSDLSLPGTHDSLAFYGGDIVRTQTLSLSDQLNSGIRVLDIRCRHIADRFAIHHGPIFQNAFFGGDVMEVVIDFLQAQPHETVLMRVKEEHHAENTTRSFEETFAWYMGIYGDHVWTPTHQNPTLDEVRGKIVILQDFPSDTGNVYGLVYSHFQKQDNFHLTTNWDLYDKWLDVKDHIERAQVSINNRFYINFLSGSGGSFPYFVASGHSSNGTSAPRLLTGATTLFSNPYPEFPRVGCGLGVCSVAFEGTNVMTYNYLRDRRPAYAGIIMADFPGGGLIDEIIHLNPVARLPEWATGFPQVSLRNARDTSKCLDVAAADTANGTRFQVWECNQTAAQTFIEENVGGRTVYHSALDFYKCLDFSGADVSNGTGIQLYDCNYTDAQMWRQETLPSGLKVIRSALDDWKCMDMSYHGTAPTDGTAVQIWDCNGLGQQQWQVENRHGREALTFRSALDQNKCMDVAGGNTFNGNSVRLWDCNGTASQQWVMDDSGRLHSWLDYGKCLDVENRSIENGSNLQIWDCQDERIFTQRWDYDLRHLRVLGKCADIEAWSTTNGATIHLWDCHGGENQIWPSDILFASP